jgi:hypothetical protein
MLTATKEDREITAMVISVHILIVSLIVFFALMFDW